MFEKVNRACLTFLWLPALLFTTLVWGVEDAGWLNRKVVLKPTEGTIYQLLRQVSEQTGYLFIYDSQLINNDQKVKLNKKEYTLREAIYAITGNRQLKIELVGNHILLSLPSKTVSLSTAAKPEVTGYTSVTGLVFDLFSKEEVASANVSLNGAFVGTITNQAGNFRINIPDSLQQASIKISHIGYENAEIKVDFVANRYIEIALEPKVVPLQEVIIRPANPIFELRKMLENREENYAAEPIYLTSFYREVVERKNRNQSLTEAVLKTYKTEYAREQGDQVKLIKMRHVVDRQKTDTLFTRVKSGIQSTMLLDIMKGLPDFLIVDDPENSFVYTHADINTIDGRLVNVISFEQKKSIKQPLHRGLLFIDMENYALVEARFEIHPDYVKKATAAFVEKKSRNLELTLRKASYTVSYKPDVDGVYVLNYVRGDIGFKVRKKGHLFNSSLDIWFEMVTCDIDKENVHTFPRSERISTRTVFSETAHEYDANFWGNFNVILPEEELKRMIMSNLSEIVY